MMMWRVVLLALLALLATSEHGHSLSPHRQHHHASSSSMMRFLQRSQLATGDGTKLCTKCDCDRIESIYNHVPINLYQCVGAECRFPQLIHKATDSDDTSRERQCMGASEENTRILKICSASGSVTVSERWGTSADRLLLTADTSNPTAFGEQVKTDAPLRVYLLHEMLQALKEFTNYKKDGERDRGSIHSDYKLGNVFVKAVWKARPTKCRLHAKLGDFGTALCSVPKTEEKVFAPYLGAPGTPDITPPEKRCSGKTISDPIHSLDIFSYGSVFLSVHQMSIPKGVMQCHGFRKQFGAVEGKCTQGMFDEYVREYPRGTIRPEDCPLPKAVTDSPRKVQDVLKMSFIPAAGDRRSAETLLGQPFFADPMTPSTAVSEPLINNAKAEVTKLLDDWNTEFEVLRNAFEAAKTALEAFREISCQVRKPVLFVFASLCQHPKLAQIQEHAATMLSEIRALKAELDDTAPYRTRKTQVSAATAELVAQLVQESAQGTDGTLAAAKTAARNRLESTAWMQSLCEKARNRINAVSVAHEAMKKALREPVPEQPEKFDVERPLQPFLGFKFCEMKNVIQNSMSYRQAVAVLESLLCVMNWE